MSLEIDKLMIIHVLQREEDMVDCDISIGIEEITFEEGEGIRFFTPSVSLDDAMEGAKKINLFDGYALHYVKGAYNEEWKWHVSYVDDRGVLQGYVYASTPALAVCLACLKRVGYDIESLDMEDIEFQVQIR